MLRLGEVVKKRKEKKRIKVTVTKEALLNTRLERTIDIIDDVLHREYFGQEARVLFRGIGMVQFDEALMDGLKIHYTGLGFNIRILISQDDDITYVMLS